jgi:ABC-type glycerol-3-phosphate transport system substrate-binding protein
VPSPSTGSAGGAMAAACGSSAATDGLRQPVDVRSTGPAAHGRMLSRRAGSPHR